MTITRFLSSRRIASVVVAVAATIAAVVVPAGTAQADGFDLWMQNIETDQYLTIGNASHTDGAAAIQWTYLSGYEQQWDFIKVTDLQGDDNDKWIIRNAHSLQCLAIPASSRVNGTGAIQWPCLAVDDQRWYLRLDSYLGGYKIVNVNSDKCLAIPEGSDALGKQAIQWTCAQDLDQRWTLWY
ncbi:RICIN domain-containing protein [Kribbella sp. NPDC003505]|uniref:RICIN domain-containing protein n=1 Tax=Kribbella sp. NPDC003505 TaxID=3154448 RepID=UPI0033BEDF01